MLRLFSCLSANSEFDLHPKLFVGLAHTYVVCVMFVSLFVEGRVGQEEIAAAFTLFEKNHLHFIKCLKIKLLLKLISKVSMETCMLK